MRQPGAYIAAFVQGFAAHNGEILAAAAIPSTSSAGSAVVSGGHDWQVRHIYLPSILTSAPYATMIMLRPKAQVYLCIHVILFVQIARGTGRC